jgi:hypothetical protein
MERATFHYPILKLIELGKNSLIKNPRVRRAIRKWPTCECGARGTTRQRVREAPSTSDKRRKRRGRRSVRPRARAVRRGSQPRSSAPLAPKSPEHVPLPSKSVRTLTRSQVRMFKHIEKVRRKEVRIISKIRDLSVSKGGKPIRRVLGNRLKGIENLSNILKSMRSTFEGIQGYVSVLRKIQPTIVKGPDGSVTLNRVASETVAVMAAERRARQADPTGRLRAEGRICSKCGREIEERGGPPGLHRTCVPACSHCRRKVYPGSAVMHASYCRYAT